VRVKLWGTRGSIAASGPDTIRYGGDTSAVEVRSTNGDVIVLDGGSGLRPIGSTDLPERIDILLSHLHMDHVQGLPFFAPMFDPEVEVHVWGPVSLSRTLRERLSRYLSPPLFPVRIRDLANVVLHDVIPGTFQLGDIEVQADLICHPGITLGYRLSENGSSLTYLPDHEPAFGEQQYPGLPEWTSGFDLASNADVLIHDAQYDDDEYQMKVGWGHSSFRHLAAFADVTGVKKVVTFHHDPGHDDERLDALHDQLEATVDGGFEIVRGTAGATLDV
jgi:phosphoribosyl 1,2-cyclic phosphodiesterase